SGPCPRSPPPRPPSASPRGARSGGPPQSGARSPSGTRSWPRAPGRRRPPPRPGPLASSGPAAAPAADRRPLWSGGDTLAAPRRPVRAPPSRLPELPSLPPLPVRDPGAPFHGPSRPLGPPGPDVDQDGHHQDEAFDDLLPEGLDVEHAEAVVHAGHDERAQERPRDAPVPAGEAGTAHDAGGDGVELEAVPRV